MRDTRKRKVYEDCIMCEGSGNDLATECDEFPQICESCDGSGRIEAYEIQDSHCDKNDRKCGKGQ